ncbi:hypothetical protein [Burkholderia gladioli]|uniref:hypothetical protein n=1 Tax=Burkholderia gladioli TaxID=28095 RepID=UPI003F7A71DF
MKLLSKSKRRHLPGGKSRLTLVEHAGAYQFAGRDVSLISGNSSTSRDISQTHGFP